MTFIEHLGFFAMNLLIGNANDHQHAGPDRVSIDFTACYAQVPQEVRASN